MNRNRFKVLANKINSDLILLCLCAWGSFHFSMCLFERSRTLAMGQRVKAPVLAYIHERKGISGLVLKSPGGQVVREVSLLWFPACSPSGCDMAVDEERKMAFSVHAVFAAVEITGLVFSLGGLFIFGWSWRGKQTGVAADTRRFRRPQIDLFDFSFYFCLVALGCLLVTLALPFFPAALL